MNKLKVLYIDTPLEPPGGGAKRVYQSRNKVIPIKCLSTCNCAYRKKVFEEFGLFNERTKYSGEDYLFAEKVITEYKCLYNPRAIAYHKPRGSFKEVFKWFVRRGISEILMLKEFSGVKGVRYLFMIVKNSLIIRFSVLVILVSLAGFPIFIYLLLFTAYYFYLLLRERPYSEIYKNTRLLWLVPFVKMAMDSGMEWGRIKGLFIYWRI